MASQPLESIPEEPAPTPTPARVTADPPTTKLKNPGRVASGKRLAERNRLAREAKKKEQAEAASIASNTTTTTTATAATASASNTATDSASGSSLSLGTMLGIGGLIVSLLGVYYQREAIMAKLKPAPPRQPPTPAPSRIPVKQGIKKME